ncbi:MAG TPA: hypothetical protein VJA25_00080 [Dehalococcoidia bacterium]|nr:hypothetical protein [Dehalococcoidia bacterium]
MQIIREADGVSFGMLALFIDWGIRRCNQKGCATRPTTIIAGAGEGVPVFGLCEEHFQQGNTPGGAAYELVWDKFDAFQHKESHGIPVEEGADD